MSKLVLEIDTSKKELAKNDIIRYNDELGKFEVASYNVFNKKLINEFKAEKTKLENELKELTETIESFKDNVNEQLEKYHKILQVLTKE